MATRMMTWFCLLLLGFASSAASAAATITDPTVDGNTLSAKVEAGSLNVELSIEFEQVVGLSVANIGLSAELVNPANPLLLARLGDVLNLSPAGGLPILIRIQPPASGGLSFAGIATVELYTHNLQYTVGTPLRLFSAPDGGNFSDITTSMSSGSYRVRGSKGTFSEFLIVADLRTTASIVDAKFNMLSNLLYDHSSSIGSATFSELENELSQAQSAWDSSDTVGAIAGIEAFVTTVEADSGSSIPDVWRSARDLDNVAGLLRAQADTLRHSLTLASNSL